MNKPKIVTIIYIASTVEKVRAALTSSEITQQYWFNTRIESVWKVGSKVIYRDGPHIREGIGEKAAVRRVALQRFAPV